MPGGSAKKKGRASPTTQQQAAAPKATPTPTPSQQRRRQRALVPPPYPPPSGDDRAAATALFFLIILQAPVLILSGERAPVSPLELAAGATVAQWPAPGGPAEAAANAALLPGAWLKTAFVPYLACTLGKNEVAEARRKNLAKRKAEGLWDEADEQAAAAAAAKATPNADPCHKQRLLLSDAAAALASADVRSLASRLSNARDAPALAAGAALVAASALLGRVFSARSALVGVGLLAAGGVRGGHALLPPLWMMGFLAAYAAFGGALERRLARGGGGGAGGGVRAPAHEWARRAAESVVLLPEEGKEKEKEKEDKAAAGANGGNGAVKRRVTFEG